MWEIIYSSVSVADVLTYLLMVILFIGYFVTAIKYIKTKGKLDSIQSNFKHESDKILEEATIKSYQITGEAYFNSQKIIQKAEIFSNDVKKSFEEELREVSKKYHENYLQTLEELQLATKRLIQETSLEASGGLKQALRNFEETLKGEALKSQKDRAIALELLYKKTQEETESFKKERSREIDAKIIEIIKEVAKKTLAKALTSEEHEQMILDSLKKAKEENVF